MGLIASSLCCACQAVQCSCSLLGCCFSVASSAAGGISVRTANVFTVVLLGVVTFVAILLRYYGDQLEWDLIDPESDFTLIVGQVKFTLCSSEIEKSDIDPREDGELYAYCKGDLAVYRMSSGLQCFFLLAALLSFCGTGFHRGFWFWKLILGLGGAIGFLFLPPDIFDAQTYIYIARTFSILFLVMQLFLVMCFGYDWNDQWVANAEASETNTNAWYSAVLVSSLVLYVLSIAGIIAMYSVYTCTIAAVVLTITLLAIVGFSLFVVFRDKFMDEEGVILPAAVVSLYVTFLAYSALESHPDVECKPSLDSEKLNGIDGGNVHLIWTSVLIGALSAIYLASVTATSAKSIVSGGHGKPESQLADDGEPPLIYQIGENRTGEDMRREQQASRRDLEKSSGPSEALVTVFFYLAMILTTQYMSMTVTNWGIMEIGPEATGQFWAKVIGQWITILLFVWTLVAPAVLTDREFGVRETELPNMGRTYDMERT